MKINITFFFKYIKSYFFKFISVAIILSLVLIGSVGWNVWNVYKDFSEVVQTELEIEDITGEILYYDEALTMSARMAAATGDLDWQRRYLKYKPLLEDHLKTLLDLAGRSKEAYTIETLAANEKMLEIDQNAFDLIYENKQKEAFNLLFSQEYLFEKKLAARSLNETVGALENRIEARVDAYEHNLFYAAFFNIINFPVLVVIWTTIYGLVQWYIARQKKAKQVVQAAYTALQKANQNLEKLVKKRTEQLQKALEEAEAADRSKDRFIANISHELRTPLNSIIGYNQLVKQDEKLKPEHSKYLRIVENSSIYLLNLINDLLDISQAQLDRIRLYPSDLELEAFLNEVLDLVRMSAIEKNITLENEYDRLPSWIKSDDKRLRQILLNLLTNAIKFTDSGVVTLKVSAVSTLQSNNNATYLQKLHFEVRDTGAGMSAKDVKKVFQPFEQAGKIENRSAGVGLGLSIASELVKLMGGELKVRSQLGIGSTFYFALDFPVVEKVKPVKPENIITQIIARQGNKPKILVVDDRKLNRDLLVEMLQPKGFTVLTANNGEQMLEIAAKTLPDLILLDLFMPVKTGFTAAKQVRKIPKLENVPIVVITASSITKEKVTYFECDDLLHKPIEEKKLLVLLHKYLT